MPIFFQRQGYLCRAERRHVADGQISIAPGLHFNRAALSRICGAKCCRAACLRRRNASLSIKRRSLRNMYSQDADWRKRSCILTQGRKDQCPAAHHGTYRARQLLIQSWIEYLFRAKKCRKFCPQTPTCNVSGRPQAVFQPLQRLPNPDHQLWCP